MNQLAEVETSCCPWSKLLATDTTNQKQTWAPSASAAMGQAMRVRLLCPEKSAVSYIFGWKQQTPSTTSLFSVSLFHPHGIFWNQQIQHDPTNLSPACGHINKCKGTWMQGSTVSTGTSSWANSIPDMYFLYFFGYTVVSLILFTSIYFMANN